jgi:hypothetical protein
MDWFDMGFWNKKTYNIMKRKIIIIQFIWTNGPKKHQDQTDTNLKTVLKWPPRRCN